MNVHEDWKESTCHLTYTFCTKYSSRLIWFISRRFQLCQFVFTVFIIVCILVFVYHCICILHAQIQIAYRSNKICISSLHGWPENVFELILELTLSKADYQYHLNELYVCGYQRTVACGYQRAEVSWLGLFTSYLSNVVLSQLWDPKKPRKPRDPNKVWQAIESL